MRTRLYRSGHLEIFPIFDVLYITFSRSSDGVGRQTWAFQIPRGSEKSISDVFWSIGQLWPLWRGYEDGGLQNLENVGFLLIFWGFIFIPPPKWSKLSDAPENIRNGLSRSSRYLKCPSLSSNSIWASRKSYVKYIGNWGNIKISGFIQSGPHIYFTLRVRIPWQYATSQ